MTENELSYHIRGAIFQVYNALGPGLLESSYCACLTEVLLEKGLHIKTEVPVPVFWNAKHLGIGYRIDLLVEDKVIIEVKSTEALAEVHHKQVLTYLSLTQLKLGILVNFNCDNITQNIFRKVNKL